MQPTEPGTARQPLRCRCIAAALVALIVLATLAACGPRETAQPSAPPLAVLDGTEWQLTSLQGSAPLEDSSITIEFYPQNYLEGGAGCNRYGVDYITNGNEFQVPVIHRTQDVCDRPDIMQQEAAFFAALAQVASYEATEQVLQFRDSAGKTILAFAPVPPPATGTILPGTKWLLTTLRGQPLLPDTLINLEFGETWYTGVSGCNYYGGGPDGGEYSAGDDGTLTIEEIMRTAILCSEPAGVMEQEEAYFGAFASAATYRLIDDRLELQDANGETVLVYTRRPECAAPPADLAGTTWQLAAVDGQAPGEGSATTLAFLDGRWFVQSSRCDAYITAYQPSGYELGAFFESYLGRACQEEAGQGATFLESPSDYCLAEGRLEITTARGQVFVYDPLPETAQLVLEGPTWSLLSIVGQRQIEGLPVPVPETEALLEGAQITLSLKDGTASGSAGCNSYGAAYTIDGDSLAFGDIVATEQVCLTPEGVMVHEQRYLAALKDVTRYRIYGHLLWLETDDGRALAFLAPESK